MATSSIPSLARRERERAATRQKILNAARRMLVQHGYEGTTMRAIAAKIGYTPTAIYHYFKDKDALVAELSAIDYRAFSQALQRTGSDGNPVDRLANIGAAYVEFGLTHPMQYQFLFMMRRPLGSPSAMYGNPEKEAYAFLRQTCAEAIATGQLHREFTDPDELAQMSWASVHGLVSLRVAKGDDPSFPWRDVRQVREKLSGVFRRGLARGTET